MYADDAYNTLKKPLAAAVSVLAECLNAMVKGLKLNSDETEVMPDGGVLL